MQRLRTPLLLALAILGACGRDHWQVMTSATYSTEPVENQGRLYVTSSSYGIRRRLKAYDARSGEELWQVDVDAWEDCPKLVARGDRVLVACGASVYGFDAITGQRVWDQQLTGSPENRLFVMDRAAVATTRLPSGELELSILNADSGEPIVRRPLPADSQVYNVGSGLLTTSGETVAAIDLESGAPRWSLELNSPIGQLIGSAAGLFALTSDAIVGIDPATGRQIWRRPTDGQVAPATLDGLICYPQGGLIYGIDADTGAEKWHRRMPGVVSAPFLTHDIVYIHTAGGVLHALSSVDGESLWKLSIGAPGRWPTLDNEYYAWVTSDNIQVVDLSRRQLEPPIPLDGVDMAPGSDSTPEPVYTPLLLSGPLLYGIERGHRLFMYNLEP